MKRAKKVSGWRSLGRPSGCPPLGSSELEDLVNYLERKVFLGIGCDDTLRYVNRWARRHVVKPERLQVTFEHYYGDVHCDCDVIYSAPTLRG